ncbi:MAG TPA: hypothetical protein DEA44_07380 [Firmicutes bacterium]|nr:hypothetical protein [Bacillota bacterium]
MFLLLIVYKQQQLNKSMIRPADKNYKLAAFMLFTLGLIQFDGFMKVPFFNLWNFTIFFVIQPG